MLIYIMRHGPAGQHGDPNFPDDSQRPLTEDGIKKTRRAARGLASLQPDIDAIYTSPLVRAHQTAEIARRALGLPADALVETPNLSPGATPANLFADLAQSNDAGVLLVGHEPDLSQMISLILTADPDRLLVALRKPAIALVETDAMPPGPSSTLHFVLQPRHLRALA